MIKRTFFCLALVALMVASTSVAEAQRGGGQRGGRGFGGFGGGGPIGLVSREDVQKELGLTEDQIGDIEKISESAREGIRDRFSGFQNLRDASQEEREQAFARMREEGAKMQQEQRAQVQKVLNSEQRSRFAQLEFQDSLRRGSVQGALDAAGIDMSESDRQKLNDTREEVQQRVEAEIAKIRRDAQNEILATVVSEKQIEKMTGEPFEFASEQRRGGRGGRDAGGRDAGGREERARRRPASGTEDNDSNSEDSGASRRRRR